LCNLAVIPAPEAENEQARLSEEGPMKLLIVEDEPNTGDYLRRGLTQAGFTIHVARDGLEGLKLALSEHYDLVVLDIVLPTLDGWEVLRRIRLEKPTMSVLFLTARDDIDDRVKGLELGADDYLVKPFAFPELVARIRTRLRRGQAAPVLDNLSIADLEMDLLRRRVTRAGQKIDLTQKEFALLELLMRRAGEVLPRMLIASQVWDMNFYSETNAIDVAVRRLRSKVDDDFEPKLIRTVRGVGYVLESPQS
jgi:two-component system copper resistance phosphate regulon response regulator CusR